MGPAALTARTRIDAEGLLVLPGMVDARVHLMEPGDGSRETLPAGTAAAAAAGVTTLAEHTHHWPITDVDRFEEKRRLVPGRAYVDVGLAAHAWPGARDGMAPLWRAGVVFFKAFTCATHGVPALTSDLLADVFDEAAGLGAPVLVHCEDDLLTAQSEARLRAAGRVDPGLLLEWRNRPAEQVAVATACLLARASGASVAIAHVSSPEVLHVIAALGGDRVGAESCPQYLLLREAEVHDQGARRKFTPPARIRTAAGEMAMWGAFDDGRIEYLATDHAPSTWDQKDRCGIWDAPFGLPGLDTTLPLVLDVALRGVTTVEAVVARYAEAPARRYGLTAKGRSVPGADADLVLVDPEARTAVDDLTIHSRAGWSPYAGRPLRGAVARTLLRGEEVAVDGSVSDPPRGRLVLGPGAVAIRPTWPPHRRRP